MQNYADFTQAGAKTPKTPKSKSPKKRTKKESDDGVKGNGEGDGSPKKKTPRKSPAKKVVKAAEDETKVDSPMDLVKAEDEE
jgi:hypothetical protein